MSFLGIYAKEIRPNVQRQIYKMFTVKLFMVFVRWKCPTIGN